MSSVGVTFANRVLGLRLAPALQIDKAKVVPVLPVCDSDECCKYDMILFSGHS